MFRRMLSKLKLFLLCSASKTCYRSVKDDPLLSKVTNTERWKDLLELGRKNIKEVKDE